MSNVRGYWALCDIPTIGPSRNWISHEFFAEGGVLELVLGPKESEWGTHIQDLPPSLSDYH